MRTVFCIALVVLLTASCGSNKPTVISDKTVVRDSISTVSTIIPRDTIVAVPKDSLSIVVPIKEITETPKEYKSETGRSKARVSRTNENINIDCVFEELELKLRLLDTQLEIFKQQSKVRTITQQIDVPFTPWWVKILAWIGAVFLALLAGTTIFKYFTKR